jgi:hypothetical protein
MTAREGRAASSRKWQGSYPSLAKPEGHERPPACEWQNSAHVYRARSLELLSINHEVALSALGYESVWQRIGFFGLGEGKIGKL